jgi:lipoprotein-anchoring transpeptidase ErfK/SrfK
VIPAEELQPLSPDVPPENKRIEVSIGKQQITAYEGRRAVFMAQASTGDITASPNYKTPTGIFDTYYKRPSRHMDAGDLTGGGDDLPGVPWVSYFHEDGIAFHGVYWHNDFGNPRSHGCVNLSIHAAKWIYLWTNPVVRPDYQLVHRFPGSGTKVEIKY